jgi:2,3-bisphosphoglycerate-dependent phosphoglycerate mutase
MGRLILIRHGQSQWNLENRFTGWIDIPLSPHGEEEARRAGQLLKDFKIDRAFTSALTRAQQTLDIILKEIHQAGVPIKKDQALNERHYGDLQGLNKADTAKRYGEEQVLIWRRSYDVRPPGGESLKDTAARTLPYFTSQILPEAVKAGRAVLVCAHGNSLRSIVMDLDRLSPEEIMKVEIPTGEPIVYEISSEGRALGKRVLRPAEP